jgi:hypothetical protein
MEGVNDVKDSCCNVTLRRSCQCGPTPTRRDLCGQSRSPAWIA